MLGCGPGLTPAERAETHGQSENGDDRACDAPPGQDGERYRTDQLQHDAKTGRRYPRRRDESNSAYRSTAMVVVGPALTAIRISNPPRTLTRTGSQVMAMI